ncbi:MAG: glutaminyl-peptide cyclotransferase [Candidatus Atribacteria bacterium]|nr:glutaminyl-peptide cyclotransferase [Candidatus Atribacteria bacterium]
MDEPLGSFLRHNGVPRYSYRVVASYPHDRSAFTQGLLFEGGILYESTGLYGESSLRRVDLETGEILQKIDLEDEYFAEGITVWEDKIIQLTWESRVAFVYDKKTLKRLETRPYPYEGWGITFDGENLIVSDGSETLRFLDPADFTEKRKITVEVGGQKIDRLNELEYVAGKVYANIWYGYEDLIVVIDPRNGGLLGWIDLTGLAEQEKGGENVLNGIAFDSWTRTFLVTGKRWHRIYRVKIEE